MANVCFGIFVNIEVSVPFLHILSTKYSFITYTTDAEDPLHLSAIQESPTTIHVYWITARPIKRTIGYRIYYRGATNGTVDIDDPEVDNFVLTGLKNNATYTVYLAGKSKHLPSERLEANPTHLGE